MGSKNRKRKHETLDTAGPWYFHWFASSSSASSSLMLRAEQPRRRSARLGGTLFSETPETVASASNQAQESAPPPKEAETQGRPLEMELALPPPGRFAAGVELVPPLVVTFKEAPSHGQGAVSSRVLEDISGVWAFLSLVTEDQTRSLAPPREDLLQGSVADSIHPLCRQSDTSVDTIGYVKFENLKISEPGRYKFRVSVFDMNVNVQDEASGGRVLPTLHSQAFDVVRSSDEVSEGSALQAQVVDLKNLGICVWATEPIRR